MVIQLAEVVAHVGKTVDKKLACEQPHVAHALGKRPIQVIIREVPQSIVDFGYRFIQSIENLVPG